MDFPRRFGMGVPLDYDFSYGLKPQVIIKSLEKESVIHTISLFFHESIIQQPSETNNSSQIKRWLSPMDTKQNVSHRLLLSIAKVAHQLWVRHTLLTGLGDAGPRGLTRAGVYVNEERPREYHDAGRSAFAEPAGSAVGACWLTPIGGGGPWDYKVGPSC